MQRIGLWMLLHHKHPHVRFVATHRLTFVPDPRHVTACAQEMKSNADIMAEAKASGKTYQVSQRASAPPKARNSARVCARECCRRSRPLPTTLVRLSRTLTLRRPLIPAHRTWRMTSCRGALRI